MDGTHPAVLATIDTASGIGYSPSGALQNVKYGNNIYESTVYNHQGQPCRINVNTTGAVQNTCDSDQLPTGNIQDFTLNYNETTADNGNVAGFAATGQQNFNRSYGYDSLNRIQSMSAPGDACSGLSWTIDAWGNRTAQTATSGNCYQPQVSVDTNNRLSGAPYQYDAAGNLLSDGNHLYTYDAENRVTQVDSGNTATYVYDSSGNRVEKTVGGTDSQYLYDANGQINTVFGNGVFQRMYVYLNGMQLAEYVSAGNTTYFVHTDHLGSTGGWPSLSRFLRRLGMFIRHSEACLFILSSSHALGTETLSTSTASAGCPSIRTKAMSRHRYPGRCVSAA